MRAGLRNTGWKGLKGLKVMKGWWAPNSLRFQLLSRTLLILAGLLILVGVFQYLYMKPFLYQNKVAGIQSQINSIHREGYFRGEGDGGGDVDGVSGKPPLSGGSFPQGEAGPVQGFKEGPDMGKGGYGQYPRTPGLGKAPFIPDSTISFWQTNGTFTVVSETELGGEAVQLPDEKYQEAMQTKRKMVYEVYRGDDGFERIMVLQPVQTKGKTLGVVQFSTYAGPIRDVLVRQLATFMALSMLAMLAGLLGFMPILKRTLVPLSNIGGTVERIDAGSLSERLPSSQGQLEIDQLAKSFNRMLERLESSFEAEKEAKEQMRRFVADASHELRTPLTSIHGFLEVILRGAAQKPEQLERALKSMYGESERINKLVEDLLLLAKLDRAPSFTVKEEDLSEDLLNMEAQLRLLAGQREVVMKVPEGITAEYDKDKIKQVILNLFHNAVQHTDTVNGRIEVSLDEVTEPEAEWVRLGIKDNGPGIPADHLPHLFERFYRVDSSRSRKLGGSGLGLSISKSIVDHHGGELRVSSTLGEGSLFQVLLPKRSE